MNKLLIIIFLLYSTSAFSVGQSIYHVLKKSITVNSIEENGNVPVKLNLSKDSSVRFINTIDNMGKWYQEVIVVDENDSRINDNNFKVSKQYAFRAVSEKIVVPINLVGRDKKEHRVNKELNYVIIYASDRSWKYYDVIITDDEGNIVDHNGDYIDYKSNPDSAIYRITQSIFDDATSLSRVKIIKGATSQESDYDLKCKYEENLPSPPKEEIVPESPTTPNNQPQSEQTSFWPDTMPAPIDDILDKRSWFRKTYPEPEDCESALRNYESNQMKKTSWASYSTADKANKIYELSKSKWNELKDLSAKTGKSGKSGDSYLDYINGHYFHSAVTPELVTCISFQETRGGADLNPNSYNYSYCAKTKTPTSSAVGLGQMTQRTLYGMLFNNEPRANHFPLLTKDSKRMKGLKTKDAHREISKSPSLQIETIFRTLNEKAKLEFNKSKGKLTGTAHLKATIASYDQDGKSKYVNAVKNCNNCLKSNGAPLECYQNLLEDNK